MPSKSEAPTKSGYYALDDNDLNLEVARLKSQYLHFKTVFGSNTVLPTVNINHVSKPNVRDRDVQVFACDISSTKFPQEIKSDVDKITFFEHDVTKPFPDNMLRTFDLSQHELHNPGGYLTLRDADLVMFTHERPPPLDGQEPDIAAYTQGKSTFATTNWIFSGWALQQGFDISSSSYHRLSYHFQKMLQDASLQGILFVPQGAKRDISFAVHRVFFPEPFSCPQLGDVGHDEAGCLELGDGTRIADEEERKALMREVQHFVEGGIFLPLSEWVVVRPLRSSY
ncbi:hypothetical protein EDB89DRAFT_1914202 [Lactarius sanguifluus]|nr:hypothetical protein EDB89DRAFT_1914202 [Lactarius sanguifluus]